MNDAFATLVGPIFRAVLEFPNRLGHGDEPPLETVRAEFLNLLAEAEQRAAPTRDLATDLATAKPALVYWIDEMLINGPWAHAGAWRERILEWEFYRERLGGEAFFEKARAAETLNRTDPLEVFFLCVTLGFQGKYTYHRDDLRAWAEHAYGRIAGANPHPERFLPDEPRDPDAPPLRPLPGKAALLNVSILVSITALVTLACFLLAFHLTD